MTSQRSKEKYDPAEQDIVLDVFKSMLQAATKDGGNKRRAGRKPPWWEDDDHVRGMYSHIGKWEQGEGPDRDSKAHPLVHAAWRALAIAYQETYGKVNPKP